MKKLIVLVTAVLYLAMAGGVTVSTHYCMGERDGVKLGNHRWSVCPRCGMEEQDSEGCCKDEQLFLKIFDPAQAFGPALQIPVPQMVPVPLPEWFTPCRPLALENSNRQIFTDSSPPPLIKDRTVCFRVFRI